MSDKKDTGLASEIDQFEVRFFDLLKTILAVQDNSSLEDMDEEIILEGSDFPAIIDVMAKTDGLHIELLSGHTLRLKIQKL